ncbi:MAG TPA: PQQ-binding-like beta-propeller repeat protein, partial [Chthoniobacteraceae bacterium]
RESSSSTASTPCVIEGAKGSVPQLVLIGRTTGATGVDIPSGKALWNVPGILPRRCVASPIVTESGLIIAQCGEGSAESFVVALRPGASEEPPKKVYDLVRIGGYVPTPIAVGDLLFLFKDNGLVSCVRASDRHQLWSERVEGGFYGSPIHAQGRLYNMTKRGDLVVLNAGEKFELLARVPLGEGSHASPAASGGRLYLRTFTHLICIGK